MNYYLSFSSEGLLLACLLNFFGILELWFYHHIESVFNHENWDDHVSLLSGHSPAIGENNFIIFQFFQSISAKGRRKEDVNKFARKMVKRPCVHAPIPLTGGWRLTKRLVKKVSLFEDFILPTFLFHFSSVRFCIFNVWRKNTSLKFWRDPTMFFCVISV